EEVPAVPEIDENRLSVITDSKGFLRLITAGAREDTSISRIGNSITSAVNAGEKTVVERKYDSRFRIIREIIWKRDLPPAPTTAAAAPATTNAAVPATDTTATAVTNTAAPATDTTAAVAAAAPPLEEPEAILFYEYQGDTFFPARTRRETAAGATVTIYNDLGLVEKIEEYRFAQADPEKDSASEVNPKEEFLFSEEYAYDEEKRVILHGKTLADGSSESIAYYFIDKERPPDTKQWINDILVQQTVYTAADEWQITAWFEDDYTVHVYFRDGIRYKEEYMHNNTLLRTRQF
ncbi:MAG: hypothetical protein LBU99_03105, partial [Spirochaetaceae bacterium]|nr:hypothetical protein [Spirochaetaceae bacterium]